VGFSKAGEEVEGGVGGAGDPVRTDVEGSFSERRRDDVVRATPKESVGSIGNGFAGAMDVQAVRELGWPSERCV
jgi:hypothetical protein